MKKHSFDLKASMETIARQSGNFHVELTKCVKYIRQYKEFDTTTVRNSRINEVIKLFTGISTSVYIVAGTGMSTLFPMLSGTHVLTMYRDDDFVGRMVSSMKELGELKGSINPNTGMVSGDFSRLKTQIKIGADNLNNNLFTNEEIAAVIIHEVGHLFTYFQYLSTVVIGPAILTIAANALLRETDRKKRTIILQLAGEKLGLDRTYYKEDYINNPQPGVDVMLLNDYLTSLPQGTLDMFYNVRLSEQMADTFAVKHCGAKHLASYLSKFKKQAGWEKPSFFSHLLAEAGILFKLIGIHGTGIISILFKQYIPEKYDRPNDRFEYMKLMLIDELKSIPASDKELRDTILSEIEVIDSINNDFVYRRDVIRFFWDTLGKGKSHQKSAQREKTLERMVYNELFYKATQLKQLATK